MLIFSIIVLFIISLSMGGYIYLLQSKHKKLQLEKKSYEKSTLRNRLRNDRDLDMARKIQQGLLVAKKIQNKNIQLSAVCYPAEKIGGDFFSIQKRRKGNVEQIEEQKGIINLTNRRQEGMDLVIGDVSGHGVASALVMILAKNCLEDLLNNENYDPKEIMQIANKQIMNYTEGSEINFVTVFLAKFNCQNNILTFSKAGHTAPLLFRKNGKIEQLETEGVFLGMFENPEFEEKQIKLEKGDKLFLYTDGLNEAKNANSELLGIKKLKDIIKNNIWLSGEYLLNKIIEEVKEYASDNNINDDVTMIAFEVS